MAKWRYRKRTNNWRRWITPALALCLVAAWYFYQSRIAPQEWVSVGSQFGTCGERGRPFSCVSDGDTVTLGYGAGARRIRLTGFDAPETNGSCPEESAAAIRAQTALRIWLNRGPFEWDGGAKPPRDKYGRELRSVRRVDRNGRMETLADHMIDAKLAAGDGPWEWHEWCN